MFTIRYSVEHEAPQGGTGPQKAIDARLPQLAASGAVSYSCGNSALYDGGRATDLAGRGLELVLKVLHPRLRADQNFRQALVLVAYPLELCDAVGQKLFVVVHHLGRK